MASLMEETDAALSRAESLFVEAKEHRDTERLSATSKLASAAALLAVAKALRELARK